MSGRAEVGEDIDSAWDDPLPHALSPTRYYLSRPRKGHTKAVAILVHGRGDNCEDFVGSFLPVLSMRYGGKDHRIEDEDDDEEVSCKVAIIGIEARDNSWYPQSHNAISPQETKDNAPYQYSSLQKIRQSIILACEPTGLQPEQVILVGFSQGANLANTYLQIGLSQIAKGGKSTVPLPGHILPLAGALFKVMPSFPQRQYLSPEHKGQFSKEEDEVSAQCHALRRPKKVVCRLICGTGDRFFSQEEIEDAAATLANESSKVDDRIDVQISVLMEPRAPHTVTNRMLAATIEAIDAALSRT
jgi:predicted esterase